MMRPLLKAVLAASMIMTGSVGYAGSDTGGMTQGEVTKVDTRRNRLTIKHGPIENLGMDGMTMVFEVADPAMIEGVQVGSDVSFVVERIQGKLTITRLEQ